LPVLFFQMALAIMMAHATELAHQCLHRTGTGSAFWDQLFGTMLSWPTGVCFQLYRWFHIWHHKENGSDIDAESFGCTYQLMQAPSRIARIAGFLRHISMADHFLATLRRLKLAVGGKLAVALNAEAPHVSMGAALRIEREYQQMAFAYLALILVSVWTPALIRFWLIPLLMWGPFHALIELPEHWATAPRPNRDTFKNTRTIRAGWFANWLTNGNCYHV
jgi:fatty acid desaturase